MQNINRNKQQGFIAPLFIIIVVVLILGGMYIYSNQKYSVSEEIINTTDTADTSEISKPDFSDVVQKSVAINSVPK